MRRGALAIATIAFPVLAGFYACGGDGADIGNGAAEDSGASPDGGGSPDGSGGGPDAADDASDSDGAADAGPRCDKTKDFGTPTPVQGLPALDGLDGRLSPDERTIYFTALHDAGTGNAQIYWATRPNEDAPFESPALVPGVNSSFLDQSPSISDDGRLLVFTSTRTGSQGTDIWYATRGPSETTFGNPALMANVNDPASDGDSYTTPTAIYFATTRSGINIRIYSATFSSNGASYSVGQPAPVQGLSSGQPTDDVSPVASRDGLTLYFASARGTTGMDIWKATRGSTSGSFGSLAEVTSLNSANDELPTWLSPDECRLYFASNRPGGPFPGMNLWVAKRPK